MGSAYAEALSHRVLVFAETVSDGPNTPRIALLQIVQDRLRCGSTTVGSSCGEFARF